MNYSSLVVVLVVALGGFLLGYIFAKTYFLTSIRHHRKDAVKKSKSVLRGQDLEKVAPLLTDFPYKIRDMVFVGKGVDYIVFDGLSTGKVNEIVFIEIKSGSASQNARERMIQRSIDAKKVRYELRRV